MTRNDTDTVTTTTTTTTVKTNVSYVSSDVECDGDKNSGSGPGYPNNDGNDPASEWTSTQANSYWAKGGALLDYTFYSGNYINYLNYAKPPTTTPCTSNVAWTCQGTRMTIMQGAMNSLLDNLSTSGTNVNVGLMRYDTGAKGGMLAHEISPISTAMAGIKSALNSYSPGGNTPLSEALYEGYLYYTGSPVKFGDTSNPFKSVAASRVGNALSSHTYQSPITSSCYKNYIVYLTDGQPTADFEADTSIKALPNFGTVAGPQGCVATTYGASNGGDCLGALSQYMYRSDMSSGIVGTQGVSSYFIGFGSDFDSTGGLNTAFSYLSDAANRGGGLAYTASDSDDLTEVLTKIVQDAIIRNTSFAAPAVAVNAFNRTQTLNDLYISMFQPSSTKHWPGNVKKYHVKNGVIVDASGNPAVDPAQGFFTHSSKSFWTKDPDGVGPLANGDADGENVIFGGAARNIPSPDTRKLYTFIGANPSSPRDLTVGTQNKVSTTNSSLTSNPALLGDATLSSAAVTKLINWARGMDVDDVDNKNNIFTDARGVMGDPVHARPAAIVYGGTQDDPDTVIYAPTNDGYLHAIGGKDTDGAELWAFIPQELLPEIKGLYDNSVTATKHYSLDGNVAVLKYDQNGNGIVDATSDGKGDRVFIYFSQGRGGSRYYALDVTDKNAPKFMWSIGGNSELPGIGQSWSTPFVTRMNIRGTTQNSQKLVLVFGGGYDPVEDTTGYHLTNAVGNHIYVVDALYGTLLWSAGSAGHVANFSRMDHSIPGNVTVLDLNGDSYADRMYAADTAGQVWRFDITNGATASNLVTGGVIASLGAHESHSSGADNRRFYSAPDVASVQPTTSSAPYFNIAIGSGYRGHPLNTITEDRFYAVHDLQPYNNRSQAYYDGLITTNTFVKESDLTDITETPNNAHVTSPYGWLLKLNYPSWQGEKVLSTSTTFDNKILFTTYLPINNAPADPNSCSASNIGVNRAYVVSVFDGSPVKLHDQAISGSTSSASSGSSGNPTRSKVDRFDNLAQSGIAPEAALLFTADNKLLCLHGAEVSKACNEFKSRVKTYWREAGAP
jgi:type IV pilus assembly protein PilY1